MKRRSDPEMSLEKKYMFLLGANALAVAGFTAWYLSRGNLEFIIFVSVIIFFMAVLWFTRNKVDYPMPVLWALSAWGFFHMLGGSLVIGDTRLYDFIFIPIVGEPYLILKFDQIIHAYGFGVSTFVAFHLLKPVLREGAAGKVGLAIVLAMAGLGAGALNEIIEFAVTIVSPESGIGGYVNNSLDLVANGTGSTIAAIWIYFKADKH